MSTPRRAFVIQTSILVLLLAGVGVYLLVQQDRHQRDLAMMSRSYDCDTIVRLGGDGLSSREDQQTTFGMVMSNRIATDALELAVIDAMGRQDVRRYIGYRELMGSINRFMAAKNRLNYADAEGGTVWAICGESERVLRYLLAEAPNLPIVDLYGERPNRTQAHKIVYGPWDRVVSDSVRHYSSQAKTRKEIGEVDDAWRALKFELDRLTSKQAEAIIELLFSKDRHGEPTLMYDIGGG